MRVLSVALALWVAALAPAANAAKKKKTPVEPPPVEAASAPVAAGTVSGRVTLAELTPPRKIEVTKDTDKCGKEKVDETYLYSADKGLKNVVVWLEGAPTSAPEVVKAEPLILKNISCMYDPRVSVAAVGQALEIKNFDGVQHNSHGYLLNPLINLVNPKAMGAAAEPLSVFNVALPVKGLSIKRVLDKPGLIDIKNDAGRPWMRAYVWVFAHRLAAVTDEVGRFAIDGVPDGQFELKTWHEAAGVRSSKVRIEAHASIKTDIVYEATAK